jgi:hypothetical protein
MNWYRSLPDYRRKILLLLIVAILLTLPCYCIGLALLLVPPEESAPPPPTPAGAERIGEAASLWSGTRVTGAAVAQPAWAWSIPAGNAILRHVPQSQAGGARERIATP